MKKLCGWLNSLVVQGVVLLISSELIYLSTQTILTADQLKGKGL